MFNLNNPMVLPYAEGVYMAPRWHESVNVYPESIYWDEAASSLVRQNWPLATGSQVARTETLTVVMPGLGEWVCLCSQDDLGRVLYGYSEAVPTVAMRRRAMCGHEPEGSAERFRWHPDYARMMATRAMLLVEAAAVLVTDRVESILPEDCAMRVYLSRLWHRVRGLPCTSPGTGIDLRDPRTFG